MVRHCDRVRRGPTASFPEIGGLRHPAPYPGPVRAVLSDRSRDVARRVVRRTGSLARRTDRHLPGRAAALAYHRVGDVALDPWELAVSPRHFAQQLAVMHRLGAIVPLGRLLDQPATGRVKVRRPQFAVTFDDGYVDNLTSAVPALEASGSPATVFIAPGLLDRPAFWWDVLAALVLGSDIGVDRLVAGARSTGLLDDTVLDPSRDRSAEPDARALHDMLHARLISRGVGEIDDALERLAGALATALPVPDGRPLTTDELATLATHPLVTIGVHTMTHPQLPGLPAGDVRREITEAVERLDDLLGPQRRVLAYPYGASSPAVVRVVAELGFAHAVTTESRWVRRRDEGLSAPRLHPRDVDGDEFEVWLRRWT